MNLPRNILLVCLALLPLGSLAQAPESTPPADPKALELAEKAKGEVERVKEAWERAKLEATLYDSRFKRAYQRWTKAGKTERKKAAEAKDRAWAEFNLAVERRRLHWYRWEEAKFRQAAAQASLEAAKSRADIQRIEKRIKDMEGALIPSKDPAPKPGKP